ncbi:hypothetical protein PsorP6_003696 [Peronosclerospora sorghi]|uniref:Uncharacterized protein n=1 Tax=Peronosclerospora sorghi TaxID=230839 RepID=A0ACC0VLK9_9STRA|nr:hypothetical protein PsorP6_003696 [Peronosclerospora sorghi]
MLQKLYQTATISLLGLRPVSKKRTDSYLKTYCIRSIDPDDIGPAFSVPQDEYSRSTIDELSVDSGARCCHVGCRFVDSAVSDDPRKVAFSWYSFPAQKKQRLLMHTSLHPIHASHLFAVRRDRTGSRTAVGTLLPRPRLS